MTLSALLDGRSKALLIAKSNLARVINLCSKTSIISHSILATNSKVGVSGCGSVDGNSSFESGSDLVVDTTTEHLCVVGGDMKNHIVGRIAEGEVILNDGGLAGVEGGAVAKSPGTMSNASAAVDDWGSGETHVGGDKQSLVLVLSLQLTSHTS